jgi:hypothetical protein
MQTSKHMLLDTQPEHHQWSADVTTPSAAASTDIQPAYAAAQALCKLVPLQCAPVTIQRRSKTFQGVPWWNGLVCEDTLNSLCTQNDVSATTTLLSTLKNDDTDSGDTRRLKAQDGPESPP